MGNTQAGKLLQTGFGVWRVYTVKGYKHNKNGESSVKDIENDMETGIVVRRFIRDYLSYS